MPLRTPGGDANVQFQSVFRRRPSGHLQAEVPASQLQMVLHDASAGGTPKDLILAVSTHVSGEVNVQEEPNIQSEAKRIIPTAALAAHLQICGTTVKRKMRLMAAVTILGAYPRYLTSCQRVHHFLLKHCTSVVPSLYAIKQQYDGLDLRLCVPELPPALAN